MMDDAAILTGIAKSKHKINILRLYMREWSAFFFAFFANFAQNSQKVTQNQHKNL